MFAFKHLFQTFGRMCGLMANCIRLMASPTSYNTHTHTHTHTKPISCFIVVPFTATTTTEPRILPLLVWNIFPGENNTQKSWIRLPHWFIHSFIYSLSKACKQESSHSVRLRLSSKQWTAHIPYHSRLGKKWWNRQDKCLHETNTIKLMVRSCWRWSMSELIEWRCISCNGKNNEMVNISARPRRKRRRRRLKKEKEAEKEKKGQWEYNIRMD